MARSRKDDFDFQNHGSICILEPRSRRAKAWVLDNLPEDAQRWGRDGIVIEPRYVAPIVDGIFGDGLTIAGV